MMESDETFEVPFDIDPSSSVDPAQEQYEDVDDEVSAARDAFENNQVDAEKSLASGDHGGDKSTDSVALANDSGESAMDDAVETGGEPVAGNAIVAETGDAETVDDEVIMDDQAVVAAAVPYVESWHTLVSTTNWEKGRIISQWRQTLIQSGVSPVAYSDAAWVRRVGGVTPPHVGRLRRVYDQFANTFETYDGLYWTHFLAALDWDDSAMWLEGAVQESWSVSKMRDARWRAMGAVDSKRPTASEIIDVDLDEDVVVAPGGSDEDRGKREYDGDGPGSTGPQYDEADFGDADELVSLAGSETMDSPTGVVAGNENVVAQPFKDLPELPDDLSDAVESFKLAILRHKSAGWRDVDAETLENYLRAIAVLLK